jgi:hypothetical protein|tara:strand:+ start:311 stop:667 length:357 start_codon:yes stop_codon:yes gene_type:complete
MTNTEFMEEVFEIAFGDDAIYFNKTSSGSKQAVLNRLRRFSDDAMLMENILNLLTSKEKEKISLDRVKNWLGSDCSFDDICETLQDLANGNYKQRQLREDIFNTYYEEMEDTNGTSNI